ncbi:MAG TPA: T9SS type A sorting domain-containing protein [Saprospiraceae bacterium]|nr:T9SS type A sorting domain-containing protein [Saprospiraceae bacterium]
MKPVFVFRIITILTIFVFISHQCKAALASIHYVNISSTGLNDGTSWTNAYHDLQAAINAAINDDEIWVAAGTYFPTAAIAGSSDRDKTFFINKSIKLYGGFEGLPGSEGHFESRNVITHRTILSGDLGKLDSIADNAFQVMQLDHVGNNMVLDGFTITLGYGHEGSAGNSGAGIYNDGSVTGSSNPIIANCIFDHNNSFEAGGAFLNYGHEGEASPVFMQCIFTHNLASGGGAISNIAGSNGKANSLIINSQFKGNSARTASGGAIGNIAVDGTSSPQLYNCLFSGNFSPTSPAFHGFANGNGTYNPSLVNCTFAGNSGGAMGSVALGASVSHPEIKNSIFWNNAGGGGIFDNGATTTITYSLVPFGNFPGEGNIGLDPVFVNTPDFNSAPTTAGDLHLTAGSIAINAGNNDALNPNIPTDLDGLPRIQPENGGTGVVDMGAFEFKAATVGFSEIQSPFEWNVSPNPASDQIIIRLETSHTMGSLRICDMNGRIAAQQMLAANMSDYTIDVSHLLPGTYTVQLFFNGRISAKKLVVE